MTSGFKAFIFDLDGTLLNSIDDLTDSVNYALEKHNLHSGFSTDEIMQKVGSGIKNLIIKSIPDDIATDDLINDVLATFKLHYNVNCINKSKPYDGIIEMLHKAKDYNMKLAVLSNKADEMVKKIISHIFGDDLFDFVAGNIDNMPLKPAPNSLNYLIGELGVTKRECLFIGDSGVDMQTATNAEVFPLGVSWGYRSKDVLKQNGAKIIVDKPSEILKLLPKYPCEW